MDIQETIDSLRKVLENSIAPSIKELRARLDAIERDVQENGHRIDRLDGRVDRLTERMEEGFSRMDGRIDRLTERMEEGFSRMDVRLDTLTSAILASVLPNYPDAILTRLDRLEREIQELRKA